VLYLIAALIAMSIGLTVTAATRAVPARPRGITRQLAELERSLSGKSDDIAARVRFERSSRIKVLLEWLGTSFANRGPDGPTTRQFLTWAGFRDPAAPAVYWGARLASPVVLAGLMTLIMVVAGGGAFRVGLAVLWSAAVGWVAPSFYVGGRVRSRQKNIQRALPDALDLMVVCVEAGLALNQAMVRVSDEIKHVSELMSDELALVNLEIRAGVPRHDALRNLAERTGVADLRSLTAMLIQTDRFGTSVAHALRVHSDTMRTKRRQRAEEAAAKTTIKLVFPLATCIFPALFVVILGPALIMIYRTLGGMS
jgi:tight adherence protein C